MLEIRPAPVPACSDGCEEALGSAPMGDGNARPLCPVEGLGEDVARRFREGLSAGARQTTASQSPIDVRREQFRVAIVARVRYSVATAQIIANADTPRPTSRLR